MCCLFILATLLSPPRYCFGTGDPGSMRRCRRQSQTGSFCWEDRKSTLGLPQLAPESLKSLRGYIVSLTGALDLGGSQEIETGLYSIDTEILEVFEKPKRVTDRYFVFLTVKGGQIWTLYDCHQNPGSLRVTITGRRQIF